MSLVYWLPMNGNLKNYGVGDLTAASVQSGVAIDNNGKIGKCYTNSGSNACVSTPIVFNSNQFSLCAWVKVNSRRNNWCIALGLAGSGTYIGLGCEHTNGSSYGFHFYKTIDGNNTSIFDTYPISSQNGTWVHYAMCYDGTKYYIYINGTLIQSNNANKTNIPVNMTSLLLFGGTGGTHANCSLNDVRLYDECISAKTVKEISKALCCHYKLSGVGGENLVSNSPIEYTAKSCDMYRFAVGSQKTLSDWDLAVGDIITLSFYVKTNSNKKVRARIEFYNSDSDRSSVNGNHYIQNGEGFVYVTTTVKSGYEQIGLYADVNLTMSEITDTTTEYYKLVKLEKGSKPTPWCPNPADVLYSTLGYNDGIEYDCSGYGNNGTKVGTIAWSGDSARYSGSYGFDNSSKINISPYLSNGQQISEITISCWFKTDTLNSTQPNIVSLGENFFLRFRVASSNAVWHYSRVGSTQVADTFSCKTLTDDTWHHIAYTFKNGIVRMYIDGEQVGTHDFSSTATYMTCASSDWGLTAFTQFSEKFIGSLSDFRIYATALTESDIKSLYNTSASIDKSGVLFCGEIVEGE